MGLGSAVCRSRDALRTYNSRVAKVEPTTVSEAEKAPLDPPLDPGAIERAYRLHRARRAARERWQRERRWAGFRFWLVLILVLAVTVLLAARVLGEFERVFGL
jgi:anti-sigma-K factor RskA